MSNDFSEKLNVEINAIITYDKYKEEEHLETNMEISLDLSLYGIEKECITNIAKNVKYPTQLVRIVFEVVNMEEIADKQPQLGSDSFSYQLIKIMSKINKWDTTGDGGYYFQPDQRDEMVNQIIKENPFIARNTRPVSSHLLTKPTDLNQEMFNDAMFSFFNSKSFDEFKKENVGFIKRTFGDVFEKKTKEVM
jgi:hypothetical protein